MDAMCIINKNSGILTYCSKEFSMSTSLVIHDKLYNQIDKSIDNGDDFKDKIKNININISSNLDRYPINQQMITPDGWKYKLDIVEMMTNDYISLIIKDFDMVLDRILQNPIYRRLLYFSVPIECVLIDENKTICRVTKRIIETINESTCDTETEATNFIDMDFNKYDLFIINIDISGYISGINLLEMIKGDRRIRPYAKFVAISADNSSEMHDTCINAGFDFFLDKPLDKSKLEALFNIYKTITFR